MVHTVADKKKLIVRVRRMIGQLEAIEKALEQEQDCSLVLHQIAGCRGAMNGLMSEVLEGHVRSHLLSKNGNKEKHTQAAEDLIELVKSYLK